MDVDKVGTQLLQVGKLYRLVVHESAALATWRDCTANDCFVVVVDIQLLERLLQTESCDVELALNHAGTRVILDSCAIVLGSEQQRQSAHQNRLSGSRFARDDIERGVELDFEVLDKSVVLNNQSAQHDSSNLRVFRCGRQCAQLPLPSR